MASRLIKRVQRHAQKTLNNTVKQSSPDVASVENVPERVSSIPMWRPVSDLETVESGLYTYNDPVSPNTVTEIDGSPVGQWIVAIKKKDLTSFMGEKFPGAEYNIEFWPNPRWFFLSQRKVFLENIDQEFGGVEAFRQFIGSSPQEGGFVEGVLALLDGDQEAFFKTQRGKFITFEDISDDPAALFPFIPKDRIQFNPSQGRPPLASLSYLSSMSSMNRLADAYRP